MVFWIIIDEQITILQSLEPPLQGWVKCNTDGFAKGSLGFASYGGIFRDHSTNSLGCFSQNLNVNNSFFVELMGSILAIVIGFYRG